MFPLLAGLFESFLAVVVQSEDLELWEGGEDRGQGGWSWRGGSQRGESHSENARVCLCFQKSYWPKSCM